MTVMASLLFAIAVIGLITTESFKLWHSGLQTKLQKRSTSLAAIAPHKRARVSNVDGNLFVDESCIDCDVCRWMCSSVYDRKGIKSRVFKQPESDIEKIKAYAAMISCPVGSIRLKTPDPLVKEAFTALPNEIDPERLPGVYHLGFHHVDSYGATSYLIHRPSSSFQGKKQGSIMVDSPRFNSRLADQIEKTIGGSDKLEYMFLTHKDDVSDHQKWKKRFPNMKRIIHAADVNKDTADCEIQLSGDWKWTIDPQVSIIHTPGHTAGSLCMFYAPHTTLVGSDSSGGYDDIVCFSGDHLAYSAKRQALDGFKRYNKGNIEVQAASINLLASASSSSPPSSPSSSSSSSSSVSDEDECDDGYGAIPAFNWLLPGHGRMIKFDNQEERVQSILQAAKEFEEEDEGAGRFGVGYA